MSGYALLRQDLDSVPTPSLPPPTADDEGTGRDRVKLCLLHHGRWVVVCILPVAAISLIFNAVFAVNIFASSFQRGKVCAQSSLAPNSNIAAAPALDAIEYYTTDYHYSYDRASKYRGQPTPERERAWESLWPGRPHDSIRIQPWAMELLNRTNLDAYVKVPKKEGDGFAAWTEVHHQLQCLNLIRQYTWHLVGMYSADRVPIDLQKPANDNRLHVDHCIEWLRLGIMCHGDMTPVLITTERDKDSGWRADFNSHHTCRNFTKLQEWAQAHRIKQWESE